MRIEGFATGGYHAADIGGGFGAAGGTVTINGCSGPSAKRRKGHQRRSRTVHTGIDTADRAISIGPSGSCLIVRRTKSESRISKRGDAAFPYPKSGVSGCGLWWYL